MVNFVWFFQLQTKQWSPKIGQAVQKEENTIDYCKICKQPDAPDDVSTTLIACEAEISTCYNCIGECGCGKWSHVGCLDRTEVPADEWLCQDCANISWGIADAGDDPTHGKQGLEITPEFRANLKAVRPDHYEETHRLEEVAQGFPSNGVCASPNAKKQTRDIVHRYFEKTYYRFETEQLKSFHLPGLLEYALQRGIQFSMKHAREHDGTAPPADILHEVRLGLSDWIDASKELIRLFKDSPHSPTSQDIDRYIKDHPSQRYLKAGECYINGI